MTLRAVLSELVVVHILVAVGTVVGFQASEFLEFLSVLLANLMTKDTCHLLMHPGQLVFCPGMIKFDGGFKSIYIMTI